MIAISLATIRDIIGAECGIGGAGSDRNQSTRPVRSVSTDSRNVSAGDLFFAIRGERFDGHAFVNDALRSSACGAVVDARGAAQLRAGAADAPLLVVDDTVAALGRLAKWHRTQTSATVIAVTGSCGKTTTKNMIAHVLGARFRTVAATASFNNQIGVPLTLLRCDEDDEIVVVEIGSNSPGEVAELAAIAAPDVGVVTSVGMAHLERLGDLDGVRREKLSLFAHTRSVGIVHDLAAGPGDLEPFGLGRLIWFGKSSSSDYRASLIETGLETAFARVFIGSPAAEATGHPAAACSRHEEIEFPTACAMGHPGGGAVDLRIGLAGRHNILNAVAAIAVAEQMGVPVDDAARSLATFAAPAMRMNVERVRDITLIRDCYNANPTSMRAAIDVLAAADGRRVLVAGRMAELGDDWARWHREIGAYAARCGTDVIVAVGADAAQITHGARQGFALAGEPPVAPGVDRSTGGQAASGTQARQAASGAQGRQTASGIRTTIGAQDGPVLIDYADAEDAADGLPALLTAGDTVLFKGSRVAGLERVADAIGSRLAGGVLVR